MSSQLAPQDNAQYKHPTFIHRRKNIRSTGGRNVELMAISGTRYIGIDTFCICFLVTAGHTARYVGTREIAPIYRYKTVTGYMGSNKTTRTLLIYSWSGPLSLSSVSSLISIIW